MWLGVVPGLLLLGPALPSQPRLPGQPPWAACALCPAGCRVPSRAGPVGLGRVSVTFCRPALGVCVSSVDLGCFYVVLSPGPFLPGGPSLRSRACLCSLSILPHPRGREGVSSPTPARVGEAVWWEPGVEGLAMG